MGMALLSKLGVKLPDIVLKFGLLSLLHTPGSAARKWHFWALSGRYVPVLKGECEAKWSQVDLDPAQQRILMCASSTRVTSICGAASGVQISVLYWRSFTEMTVNSFSVYIHTSHLASFLVKCLLKLHCLMLLLIKYSTQQCLPVHGCIEVSPQPHGSWRNFCHWVQLALKLFL